MKLTKFIISTILILCIVPCLFIIPVFCAPVEVSFIEDKDFCPLLSFAVTSDALILAGSISDLNIPEGFIPLNDIFELSNIPLISFEKDKPPKVLA